MLALVLVSILDEHSGLKSRSSYSNVGIDIAVYNMLRTTNICICMKVLALVRLVYKQFFLY